MPTLNYRVEATGQNVLKTVTDEVVYGLLDELDLTRSFKKAVYITSSFQVNSNYSDGEGMPKLQTNRCDVLANFTLDQTQVPWPVDIPYTTPAMGTRKQQVGTYTPILVDSKAGVIIEHRTTAAAIALDFKLTFTTFDEACKAFDTVKSHYQGSLLGKPFHLMFSYPVSFSMYQALIEIFKAKEDYKTKDFMDWINDNKKTQISFDVRKSQLTDENADTQLMIRCQQLNCLMQFTMDQKEPDPILKDQLPDGYSISFTATIQFGRPNIVSLTTPIAIDNKVLPETLFSSVEVETHYSAAVSGVYQNLMINEYMRRSYGNFNAAHQLVQVPSYDDWLHLDAQYLSHRYRPFLVCHFTLDGASTELDLKDLGHIGLHPVVKQIMKETRVSLFDYGGLFNVAVYANDLRLGKDLLEIDDDLVLTVRSDRKDKSYHLVISETTQLSHTDPMWDQILLRYRYFFPMTIERNLKSLIDKKFFCVDYDDAFLSLIGKLANRNLLKPILGTMVALGEVTNGIYAYTQNVSQLADYLAYTQSLREDYQLPTGTDTGSQQVRAYYQNKASVTSRSLFVAFIEICLKLGHITLDKVPNQYLDPNRTIYPYYSGQGGYYGFNTPVRVFNINTTV